MTRRPTADVLAEIDEAVEWHGSPDAAGWSGPVFPEVLHRDGEPFDFAAYDEFCRRRVERNIDRYLAQRQQVREWTAAAIVRSSEPHPPLTPAEISAARGRAVAVPAGPPPVTRRALGVVDVPAGPVTVFGERPALRPSVMETLHRLRTDWLVEAPRSERSAEYLIHPQEAYRNDAGEPLGGAVFGITLTVDPSVPPGVVYLVDHDMLARARAQAAARAVGEPVYTYDMGEFGP